MDLNLFDSATNYNAVVAASSGSGKSFLANELLATNLSVGGRCWVIDLGRSYENLCEALGGQFVAFITRDAHLSVNPFGLIGGVRVGLRRGNGRARTMVLSARLNRPTMTARQPSRRIRSCESIRHYPLFARSGRSG